VAEPVYFYEPDAAGRDGTGMAGADPAAEEDRS
jgi:hypothetical protein